MKYSSNILLLLVALMQCMAVLVQASFEGQDFFGLGFNATISEEEYAGAFDKKIRKSRMSSGKKLEYAIARWQATRYLPVTGVMEESHWKYLVPQLKNEDWKVEKKNKLPAGYTVLALNELLGADNRLTHRPNGADPFVMDDLMLKDLQNFNYACGVLPVVTSYGDQSLLLRTWSVLLNSDKCDLMAPKLESDAVWPVISKESKPSVYVLALKYILYDLGFMYEGGDAFIENGNAVSTNECPTKFTEDTGIALLQAIKRRTHHPENLKYLSEKGGEPILDTKLYELLYANAELSATGKEEGYHVQAAVALLTKHGYHKLGWTFSNTNRYSKGFIKAMIEFQTKWKSMGVTNYDGAINKGDWDVLVMDGYYKITQNFGDESENVRAACFLAKYQAGEYPSVLEALKD